MIVAERSSNERDLRWAAREGRVDQTRVAYGPGRGRRAIGPVGRKR